MKQTPFFLSATFIGVVLTTAFLATSCKKENQPASTDNTITNAAAKMQNANNGAPLKVEMIHSYIFVEDAAKQKITSATPGSTLLFDTRGHTPVLAPDGHQMTLEEYNLPSGWASIKCVEMGTHIVIHLQGLMPGGVYTIWELPFKAPGFDGTFTNLIGNGALGASDGSENQFTVLEDGTATLSVIAPAESLSVFGSVPACLSEVFETHLAIAYHSDNMAHGGSPGEANTWVIPFAFVFYGSQL